MQNTTHPLTTTTSTTVSSSTALWILSGTTQVSRYQKKHSPSHTYRDHQSSLICFLHLLQSMASSLFNFRFFTQSLSSFPSDHSHLCPLKCHHIFLSYGQISLPWIILFHTQIQSPSHYQWYILIGKQWYQSLNYFHRICILVSIAASASPSTVNMSPK